MSFVIFQPLLHDPLGWKTSGSTYADTFKWKKYRSASKDKRISTYSQQYQRQLQKQQKLQQINAGLPPTANEEQTLQRIILVKKNEENREPIPVTYRYSPSKTPPAISEEPPAFINECKQRPASTNKEATTGSRASQRSPTAAEETYRLATPVDARQPSKEEKEKVIIDPNNDNSRHWITYPNTKTRQYLIDVKQCLGQLKVPSVVVRSVSASDASVERPKSSGSHRQQQQAVDQRHLFDFNLPQTPVELRAARQRIEKYRYNPSLDYHLPRPKTCPVRRNDNLKPLTPSNAPESEDEQLPPMQTTPTKDDVWTNDEENKSIDNEASTITIQTVDIEGLPNEYVEAVETANIAQEEYLKNLKTDNEKKSDNLVYRLPSMSLDNKTESLNAFRNKQPQSPPPTNNNSTRRNDFGTWVRNASNQERESTMKILRDVFNQPIMGYDIPTKQQTVFKQASGPSSNRARSASRKLGRTRHPHQRIPCEICEKQMIKSHLWDLSRSDTFICPHQAQGIKPPIIKIRA